ncbi:MFS transporter [Mesosutterella sp. OilRF-GAM-744-9]|uniref:MFS transporter n=1 Tax=Mesosutterella porci TaxID=2915351 RepID=A0ABS9MSC5_9BURK|nr:MFS transporter [Mesosutterella sp. oilRF-744-WT-GAM-9]MCG5031533.1 MFS transporter [Mesosutterella sp. oilRF-744-WT-GAM-9]
MKGALVTNRGRLLPSDALSCFFFFTAAGGYYSLLTSRMPAIKAGAGVGDAEVGLALLCLGAASITGLLFCGRLIRRFTSARLLRVSSLALFLLLPLAGLASGKLALFAVFDVCMNTQAILLEAHSRIRLMGRMQAGYSLGCILGAALGAAFAWAGAGAFANFLFFSLVCLACRAVAGRHLQEDLQRKDSARRSRLPLFVYFCGFMEICAFSSEGVVGDWGSIFLHSVKGAPESTAALSFGAAAAAMALVRLFTDGLRVKLGDAPLLAAGGLLVAAGFVVAIAADSPVVCLAGFFLAGAGVAPAVPIVMSRAGSCPGVDPGAACSAVSTIGYGTLLFLPPLLGSVSDSIGMGKAFLIPIAFALLLTAGSLVFRK